MKKSILAICLLLTLTSNAQTKQQQDSLKIIVLKTEYKQILNTIYDKVTAKDYEIIADAFGFGIRVLETNLRKSTLTKKPEETKKP